MLNQIKSSIQEAKNSEIEYSELFQDYITQVQDVSIQNELNFLLRHNTSVLGIDRIVSNLYGR